MALTPVLAMVMQQKVVLYVRFPAQAHVSRMRVIHQYPVNVTVNASGLIRRLAIGADKMVVHRFVAVIPVMVLLHVQVLQQAMIIIQVVQVHRLNVILEPVHRDMLVVELQEIQE